MPTRWAHAINVIQGHMLMDMLQQLSDAGLEVEMLETVAQYDRGYVITLPADSDRFTIADPSPVFEAASELTLADIACKLYQHQQLWVFEMWERVPGPDESDFICSFPSLEDALAAVQAFYFGVPTNMNGWLIPLHRHPELSATDVRYAIENSVNVSKDVFEGIAERRRQRITGNRIFGTERWMLALQYQFLTIKHARNTSLVLRLRRDLQEGYIVHLDQEAWE
jgi:hypothetical protein